MDQLSDTVVDLEHIAQHSRAGANLELRLWLRVLSITKLISQDIRRRLRAEFSATLPQFDLMAQLYREPAGLRLGELSKCTMVTNGNVTGLVDRLVADGLVERITDGADRRVTVARLTKPGAVAFAAMAEAHEGWLCDLMADVDPVTRKALLGELATLKTSVIGHMMKDGAD